MERFKFVFDDQSKIFSNAEYRIDFEYYPDGDRETERFKFTNALGDTYLVRARYVTGIADPALHGGAANAADPALHGGAANAWSVRQTRESFGCRWQIPNEAWVRLVANALRQFGFINGTGSEHIAGVTFLHETELVDGSCK